MMGTPLTVEVTLSLRTQVQTGHCAYVSAIVVREDGQQAVIDSKHLTGRPELLLDAALANVREYALQHWLSYQEPF
jgi:hypothetical protein